MPIRFDAAFNFRQFPVFQQFCPAAKVELRLLPLRGQFYSERRHVDNIGLEDKTRNGQFGLMMVVAEKPMPIFKQVPYNPNVNPEDDQ